MDTIFLLELLLNLADKDAGIDSGSLILEKYHSDPGYRVGESFSVTKKVGQVDYNSLSSEGFSLTSVSNQSFTFSVTVLERRDNRDSDAQIVQIIVESPEREKVLAYANALKANNPQIFDRSE